MLSLAPAIRMSLASWLVRVASSSRSRRAAAIPAVTPSVMVYPAPASTIAEVFQVAGEQAVGGDDELAVGVGGEPGAAAFRAEVVDVAVVLGVEGRLRIHLHAADRVDGHADRGRPGAAPAATGMIMVGVAVVGLHAGSPAIRWR